MDPVAVAQPPAELPRWPGMIAFALAVLTLAGLVTGVLLVIAEEYRAATYTAWIATGAGAAAVLAGLVAIFGRFGRAWGVAAVVLAVVANPPVLTWALDRIGGLWA